MTFFYKHNWLMNVIYHEVYCTYGNKETSFCVCFQTPQPVEAFENIGTYDVPTIFCFSEPASSTFPSRSLIRYTSRS